MTKKEVQKRVLQNGKPLALSKFTWDEKTNIFSSSESNLVFDFNQITSITFNTESDCIFNTGSNCTFKTEYNCTFKTGTNCTFKTGSNCTFNAEFNCIFKTGSNCTFKTESNCTFKTESNCTFKTGTNCTFKTGTNCTFKTGYDCTFKTGSGCTFKTSHSCTFKTGYDCTFKTGSGCTFKTCYGCTFNTKGESVALIVGEIYKLEEDYTHIITSSVHLTKKEGDKYFKIEGGTGNFVYIDNIASEVIKDKGSILEVIDYGKTEHSFIVNKDGVFAHGKTVEQAKESLLYKISDRDTSPYKDFTLTTEVTFKEAVVMYRKITGACESGTESFATNKKFRGKKTIKDICKITEGQYNNSEFKKFFNK